MRRGIPHLPRPTGGLRQYAAMAASMLFHVSVMVTLAVIWTSQPHGTGAESSRPVGIAVVHQVEGGEAYFLTNAGTVANGASDSTAKAAENAARLPASDVEQIDVNALLSGLLPSDSGASGDPSNRVGSFGLGDGGPNIGGNRQIPKVKTSVFGVEGEGTRFVYIFDRSDSMNGYGGLPLATAKAELVQSLQSLGRAHQFQIIFYNDSPLPYGGLGSGGAKMLVGDERSKSQAISFVRGISATGGTQHVEALKMGTSMGPDVIFFLTDADLPALSKRHREDILVRCARGGTTIHAIQFGSGASQGSGAWIESLATETGGKYRYIDVSQPSFNTK